MLNMAIQKSMVDVTAPLFEPLLLDQAVILYPSEEEFADPLEYIRSKKSVILQSGIAKIVPPDGWKPKFSLELNKLEFETKRQNINRLGEGLPYEDGAVYNVKDYKKQADLFRAKWEKQLVNAGRNPHDPLDWELAYWEIVGALLFFFLIPLCDRTVYF